MVDTPGLNDEGVIILGPFGVCCINCVPMTLPSLDINTFLAGGDDIPAELMFVPKVGAMGRIPALRTTDIEPSGLVMRLIIVGVVFDPSPAEERNGVVIIFCTGLFGFGS